MAGRSTEDASTLLTVAIQSSHDEFRPLYALYTYFAKDLTPFPWNIVAKSFEILGIQFKVAEFILPYEFGGELVHSNWDMKWKGVK